MRTYHLSPEHQAVFIEGSSPAVVRSVPVAAVAGVQPGDILHHPDAPRALRVLDGVRWMDPHWTVLEIPVEPVEADA